MPVSPMLAVTRRLGYGPLPQRVIFVKRRKLTAGGRCPALDRRMIDQRKRLPFARDQSVNIRRQTPYLGSQCLHLLVRVAWVVVEQ